MVANWTLLWIHECSLIQLFFLAFVLWRQSLLPGCYFFSVLIQLWWPVVSMARGCQRGLALAEPCSMSSTRHFGITNCGRASAAFPSPGWAGKTLTWRIREWGLFSADNADSEARMWLQRRCGAEPSPRQPWQRDHGSASPENTKTGPWIVLLLAKSSSSPSATPQQGELKDSTEEFIPPVPLCCLVLSQCPHHGATKGGGICISNIHPLWRIGKLPTPLGD